MSDTDLTYHTTLTSFSPSALYAEDAVGPVRALPEVVKVPVLRAVSVPGTMINTRAVAEVVIGISRGVPPEVPAHRHYTLKVFELVRPSVRPTEVLIVGRKVTIAPPVSVGCQ